MSHLRLSLLFLVTVEFALLVLLKSLGWYGTGDLLLLTACVVVTLLPLVVAAAIVLRNRFRYFMQSLAIGISLVALFISFSLIPLARHRSIRETSLMLTAAKSTLNSNLDAGQIYTRYGLAPPPNIESEESEAVPWWLSPFTSKSRNVPLDRNVRSIHLDTDDQCQILADHWERLPSIQVLAIGRRVSAGGFRALEKVLPKLKNLDSVFLENMAVPHGWYQSLTRIRGLWDSFEGGSKEYGEQNAKDVASLPNLELLVLTGYAFDDNGARALSASESLRCIILNKTAVTATGESLLSNQELGRTVYRN